MWPNYIKASTGVKPKSEQLADNFFHRILVNFGEISLPARGNQQQGAIMHVFCEPPDRMRKQIDRLAIPCLLAAALTRGGNFFNSEILGTSTTSSERLDIIHD